MSWQAARELVFPHLRECGGQVAPHIGNKLVSQHLHTSAQRHFRSLLSIGERCLQGVILRRDQS